MTYARTGEALHALLDAARADDTSSVTICSCS